MTIESTGFKGLFVLNPKVIDDARGYFMESYNQKDLLHAGIDIKFVQDNQSSSRKGVLRGLHYQNPPYAQTKLIRVLQGKILDVAIDLRKGEPTFGKNFSIELSSENKKQLLIPKGFAHGFVVLEDQVEVFYKCDEYYHPETEGGIIYNDQTLAIDWKLPESMLNLSEKDKKFPVLKEAIFKF